MNHIHFVTYVLLMKRRLFHFPFGRAIWIHNTQWYAPIFWGTPNCAFDAPIEKWENKTFSFSWRLTGNADTVEISLQPSKKANTSRIQHPTVQLLSAFFYSLEKIYFITKGEYSSNKLIHVLIILTTSFTVKYH